MNKSFLLSIFFQAHAYTPHRTRAFEILTTFLSDMTGRTANKALAWRRQLAWTLKWTSLAIKELLFLPTFI